MNNTDKDQENVYQCQDCSTLHPGATISHRSYTNTPYCRTSPGEALRLCDEAMVVEQFRTRVAKRVQEWLDRQTG